MHWLKFININSLYLVNLKDVLGADTDLYVSGVHVCVGGGGGGDGMGKRT